MTQFILVILVLLSIAVFFWTCKSSIEAFEDVKMHPWFGYEPGRYGPGWNRTGCIDLPKSCLKTSDYVA